MPILITLLLLILAIFGVASMMGSYATAKQAQATIEVAQVAQVNAWGNLIVILLLALAILLVVAGISWLFVRSQQRVLAHHRQFANPRGTAVAHPALEDVTSARSVDVSALIQLEVLHTLRAMRGIQGGSALTSSPSPDGRGESDDELGWLR